MNSFKKLVSAAGFTLALVGTATAGPVLNNWKFNPLGTGFATAQNITEYLDVNGNAFIELTPTSATTFSFKEHAVFNLGQADSNGQFFAVNYPGGNISATFEATGTGNFNGAFTFAGGTIKMYQNPVNQYSSATGIYGADQGTQIAQFEVSPGGGGLVDGSGNPISNGQVTVFSKATTPGGITAGYFFRGSGADLTNEDMLSFAFTNANALSQPTTTLVSEVACQFASFAGPGCPTGAGYANSSGQYFFVSNNGQFKLAEVPEPDSLALFGIALLGAGVITRKRLAKKS